MNSRVLMIASSAFLAIVGLAATFAPDEVLHGLNAPSAPPLPVLVSLLGALYFGFALTNWTAKGIVIGGIYARALSIGNFFHFMVGALTLAKYVSKHGFGGPLLFVLVCYVVFALGFGALVFGPAKLNAAKS